MTDDDGANLLRMVNLRGLKAGAIRLYPAGHPLREALTGEPDFVPRDQAEGLLTAYLRMTLNSPRQ